MAVSPRDTGGLGQVTWGSGSQTPGGAEGQQIPVDPVPGHVLQGGQVAVQVEAALAAVAHHHGPRLAAHAAARDPQHSWDHWHPWDRRDHREPRARGGSCGRAQLPWGSGEQPHGFGVPDG